MALIHPAIIQQNLSDQFRSRMQSFCKQRDLHSLTQEEFFGVNKMPKPVILNLCHIETPNDLDSDLLDYFEMHLEDVEIPLSTVRIFGEIYLARERHALLHSLHIYFFK